MSRDILLFVSGDLRERANRFCWPAQGELDRRLTAAFADHGHRLVRAHSVKPGPDHGFLSSQREGMDAFAEIDPDASIVVAEAIRQYSHRLLGRLAPHLGPMLTVANWSGQWPGPVRMLDLKGSLIKAVRPLVQRSHSGSPSRPDPRMGRSGFRFELVQQVMELLTLHRDMDPERVCSGASIPPGESFHDGLVLGHRLCQPTA